ncbi:MAG TPA: ATP-dependent RNA helicase HrpA [Verrucomicrobiae bacterium]|nr:ATP-dependent RNA helicase HrpA [Verrucomicrobiae bacterium]
MLDARIQDLKLLLPQAMLHDWVRLGWRLARVLRAQHHENKRDALLDRLVEEVRASIALREARRIHLPAITYPAQLPITARKDEIVEAIRQHQVVVIAGETGSGKTTQIPKMCLEAGLGIEAQIGCTQPRRVAALSISKRIAEELGAQWGREVGCKIRFDDRSSAHTYIKLMTDGILLAETQGDPDLSHYNALIIDEAHERSLNIDFLLGYLKTLLARRKDLKLIVTSATIDTQAFSRHFNDAPIIEVSGRVYPVDVFYHPLESESEESGDLSYVDGATQAAERVMYESTFGDLLIFMPSERDIRETADQLEGRFARDAEIIPLFGRLSSGDQQRVFAPCERRKIVIATNIAETSLTIPGIRFVIDSGLARISRYNPRTRTKRLPIEPVSQSSANQRKGRAGRVEEGVCIRLYSAEDFEARPPFTQPEIQRSNLAEVILRMKAFRLGEIESFPFVQPPTPAAIANGYALLQELGALDDKRELTQLGRDLARLPIDPTLGRMLLQSQHEHATRELLIIASGLSIQDPRERPLDQKDAAAAAHKRFSDPQSDFLSLLNIWNAVHDEWEKLRTQNQRRKFCRQQFLSYLRMREWQDLYAQLHDALEDLGTLKLNESNAAYEAIHRSILAGLIGHVARREERNSYKASGNRLVAVFPGSALHARGEPQKKLPRGAKPPPVAKSNQPEWIVAGEIVETSQLFARTLAGIDPKWIYQLAPHCCKVTHHNPHWSPEAGRVLAEEIVTLNGLEVQRRKVAFGNINSKEATAIFIRSALVEENVVPKNSNPQGGKAPESWDVLETDDPELPAQYGFLKHNRAVRQKIESWRTRVRQYDLADLDDALFAFYAKQIENISSLHELNRVLRDKPDPSFLCASEADLAGGQSLAYDAAAFPDSVTVAGQPVGVVYSYAPGEEHDGVTVRLPFSVALTAPAAELQWAVPGLRSEMISELLRSLPKSIRKELMPLPPKVEEIVREFRPAGSAFMRELGTFLHRKYGVAVPESAWPADALAPHMRPRVEIIDESQKALSAGRDLIALRETLKSAQVEASTKAPSSAWTRAAQEWERFGLTTWNFGDVPERITVSEENGLPVYAWPGLELENGSVNLRLFRSPHTARQASLRGVQRLVELAIQRDLGWLEKDLRALNRLEPLFAPLGNGEALREQAMEHLRAFVLPHEPLAELVQTQFQSAVEDARKRLPGLAMQFLDRLEHVLKVFQQVRQKLGASAVAAPTRSRTLNDFSQLATMPKPAAANPFAAELNQLAGPTFLREIPYERLPHLPRYLKALLTRIERAAMNPVKDQERQRQLRPYLDALKQCRAQRDISDAARQELEDLRWMIEEFKVSLFAQEIGTAIPVSPNRLNQQLERVRQA